MANVVAVSSEMKSSTNRQDPDNAWLLARLFAGTSFCSCTCPTHSNLGTDETFGGVFDASAHIYCGCQTPHTSEDKKTSHLP
jgi:hypothetical protein